MAINAGAWLRQTKAVYLDNATSRRDYRVQLRGNRSVILFGLYLFILIGVALLTYQSTMRQGQVEIVEAQSRLKSFYTVVIELLAGLVSLIAPALTATTVLIERQRHSFDLIFSAPVTPKYFLVGKLISSYRYTWMLLVLSLPVTAACIVLGGASWSDVLITYILLSAQGLVLNALSLTLSTQARNTVSAIITSYAASIIYLFVTAMFASVGAVSTMMGRSEEAPFFSTLNPFLNSYTQATHTTIGTHEIPNWIFGLLLCGLLCKLFMVAAGTLLSPTPVKEIRSLRVHILLYLGLLLFYMAWAVPVSASGGRMGITMTGGLDDIGRYLFNFTLPLCVFMPALSTFGVDSERRYWPDGTFRVRRVLDGTPGGNYPFILLFILGMAGAIVAGLWFGQSLKPTYTFILWLAYGIGYWTFFWALGRFFSSLFVGLRSARVLQFASWLLLNGILVIFIETFTDQQIGNSGNLWDLFPLHPVFMTNSAEAARSAGAWGALFLVLGLILEFAASRRVSRKMQVVRSLYE